MIGRCVRCGRSIWPWQHFGFYVVAPGRELRWHASHDAHQLPAHPVHVTPDDAAALERSRAGSDVIGGFANPDGSGAGNWSAYAGLSPLEQLHADGDR